MTNHPPLVGRAADLGDRLDEAETIAHVLVLLDRHQQEIETLTGPPLPQDLGERVEVALQGVVDAIHDARLLIGSRPGLVDVPLPDLPDETGQ